ncbi:CRTC2 protein, partial [Polypterus senegalus]
MSASVAGGGGPGPGSGAGSGPSNPRKFSEKIALHTQRQAEETAAFQEVMMDITSTRSLGTAVVKLDDLTLTVAHFLTPYLPPLLVVYSPKQSILRENFIFPSPDQQPSSPHIPSALNTGGSLPDLTSLHFPSPLPTPLDADEPSFPNLSGGSSTGNLASTLTHLGIGMNNTFSSQALSIPLQSNSSLQSSLSNPNLQASLGNKPFQTTSLHSSLSNPSLLSSRSSSSSQLSALGNQSHHSSMSNNSLRTSLSNSSIGSHPLQTSTNSSSVDSTASTYTSLMMTGPVQSQASLQQQSAVPSSLSTSPRRRAQLSPLVLPMGGDSRRHHSKQFSPTISPTLSSITQDSSLLGSLLDDPYMNLQEGVPQEQSLTHQLEQFNMVERLAFRNNHHQLQRDLTDLAFSHPSESSHGDQHDSPFFTKQKQSCLEGRLGNVSNIIYTGDSPPGLSKEITSALASVPGFEGVTFPLDEDLEGFSMLSDADLMLSDTSVEDSLRSDRLK